MRCLVVISFFVAVATASAPCGLPSISAPTIETVGLTPLASEGLVSSATVSPRSFATSTAANFKVALDNCGPKTTRVPAVAAPSVTAAPVQGPTETLPYNVPTPRTVANSCSCVKTVVKPQTVEQVIRVPVIRRYIQTLSRPTYETINYAAEPINCPIIEGYAC